ncbi:TlpA family protein disulfide reductase [Pseudoalteromonas rubra]|uniref:Thioredoxin domain-containing protein n=1 Tax=Pseudoalteromonas rubra TaxID=43658 RepID=A0A0U3GWX9_9GAMM|nr:hypothetical protein [Pseudoalteromonas rubra]ALU43635.1 hypothetical protein AT705_12135 [Pseudoalteromonas rubra]
MKLLNPITLLLGLAMLILSQRTVASPIEYIFITIWDEYVQQTALPPQQPDIERRFIHPDINIDQASVEQFTTQFPTYAKLQIDTHNQLAIRYGVRQTPYRLVVEQDQVQQREALGTLPATALIDTSPQQGPLHTLSGQHFDPTKPGAGFRVLFFSDSLCPFQHIPDCERRIAQNNHLSEQINYPVVSVIKPFYVDQAQVSAYQQRFKVNHEILFDSHNQLFRYFAVTELPYWVVQNKQGKVIYRANRVPSFPL